MGSTSRVCKKGLEMALKDISGEGDSCVKRQMIPECGGKIAKGSFAGFNGELQTIKLKLVS